MAWSTSGGGEVLRRGLPFSPRTIHGTSGCADGAFLDGAGSAKVMLKSREAEVNEVARRRRGGRRRPTRSTEAGRERKGWRETAAVARAWAGAGAGGRFAVAELQSGSDIAALAPRRSWS